MPTKAVKQAAPVMGKDTLEFFKDYLLRTRQEIDIEKEESTKILNLKIVLIGAFLVLARGTLGLLGMILMPFGVLALDHMQLSRLDYILHRWGYLSTHAIPKLRLLMDLPPDFEFFEETVVKKSRIGYYHSLEKLVRTFLIVPTILVSSISLSVLMFRFGHATDFQAHLGCSAWIVFLVGLSFVRWRSERSEGGERLYRRPYILAVAGIALVLIAFDLFTHQLNLLNTFRDLLSPENMNPPLR